MRALRAGDRAATAVRRPLAGDAGPGAGRGPAGPLPRTATVETLSALQAAADGGDRLWIGYVDNEGSASQRVIEPITVEGGRVSAFDHRRGEVATFAVHRITGVAALDVTDDPTIPPHPLAVIMQSITGITW